MNERGELGKMLDQSFAFLQSLGFRGPEVSVQVSRLIGESLVLRYQHPILDRQINITYNEGSDRILRSIVITIMAGKRSFLLEDYLKSIGKPNLIGAFSVPRDAMSEAEFIDSAAAAFRKISDDSLSKTLEGLEWPSVDFDWKGMR